MAGLSVDTVARPRYKAVRKEGAMPLKFLKDPKHAKLIAATLRRYDELASVIESTFPEDEFLLAVEEKDGGVFGTVVKKGVVPRWRLELVAHLLPQRSCTITLTIVSDREVPHYVATHNMETREVNPPPSRGVCLPPTTKSLDEHLFDLLLGNRMAAFQVAAWLMQNN